jgi:hypothetical protein
VEPRAVVNAAMPASPGSARGVSSEPGSDAAGSEGVFLAPADIDPARQPTQHANPAVHGTAGPVPLGT